MTSSFRCFFFFLNLAENLIFGANKLPAQIWSHIGVVLSDEASIRAALSALLSCCNPV